MMAAAEIQSIRFLVKEGMRGLMVENEPQGCAA